MMGTRNNLEFVTIAKGIAILLIVVSHFIPDFSPNYWKLLNEFLYTFHVPVFFFISGYLFGMSQNKYRIRFGYLNLIRKKFQRILLPFFSTAVIALFIKIFTQSLFQINHPVNLESIINMFVMPQKSYYPLLWFLYVLFLMFVITPVLFQIFKKHWIIFVIILMANLIEWSEYFSLNRLFYNFIFFFGGIWLNSTFKIKKIYSSKSVVLAIMSTAILLVLFTVTKLFALNEHINTVFLMFMGFAGISLCLNLSIFLESRKGHIKRDFKIIGIYSMSIYLFHPILQDGTRIILYQIFKEINIPFICIALITIISGILFAICSEKYFTSRFRFTRKMVLGNSSK